MPQGLFIVVEGIDGSGKGTLIAGLREFLMSKGIGRNGIVSTREPSDSEYGKKAREILKTENEPGRKSEELLDLYLKDRKEHIEKEIMPALKNTKIVICDRYKYSTVAYQAAQGLNINELVEKNKAFAKPDICFILDLSSEEALKRIEGDSRRASKEMFEKKEFLKKVRENFLKMKILFPGEHFVEIDASKSRESVLESAKSELDALLF